MTKHLSITARDPLVARDGRPFGAGQGNRMRSVGWPYPSVVAGSFRTALAKAADRPFDEATQKDLLAIEVAGLFPVIDGDLLLPAPHDCVIEKKDDNALVAHPVRPGTMKTNAGEGADWPEGADLRPVMLPGAVTNDFKPAESPAFWPIRHYIGWLTRGELDLRAGGFITRPMEDLRDHVSILPETGAAEDGKLFTTAGVAVGALPWFVPAVAKTAEGSSKKKPQRRPFGERLGDAKLTARVKGLPPWATELKTWHPLGGERRLVHWEMGDEAAQAWECPGAVKDALRGSKNVLMILASPAVFTEGWKPGWLGPDLIGTPPGGGPRLKLVGVCIPRWRAVSGWDYVKGGPKAIRRLVSAGGTYFFEVVKGDAGDLVNCWLRPVSDDRPDNRPNPDQERLDGFGLAVWGVWKSASNEE